MRIPKYRKHTTRDRAFVELSGRRHYLPGRYDSPESRAAYRAICNRLSVESGKAVAEIVTDCATLRQLAVPYLEWAEHEYPSGNRGSFHNIRRAISRVVSRSQYNLGHLLAVEFGPLVLQDVQRRLVEDGFTRPFVNDEVSKIKAWFKWLASRELIPTEVYQRLTVVRGLRKGRTNAREHRKRKPVQWQDVEPALDHLTPVVRAMLLLQWYSGARSGSICQARPDQFEPYGDVLLWRPKHKTEHLDHEVTLPLGPNCRAAIADYLDCDPCFSPRSVRRDRRYNTTYRPYTYRQSVQRAQVRAIHEAQRRWVTGQVVYVPDLWTPHQLRHSRGQLVRDKHGLEAAQAVLGHASVQATQLYARRRLDLAIQIALESG